MEKSLKLFIMITMIFVFTTALFGSIFSAVATESSTVSSGSIPGPVKNLVNSFSGMNFWGGIKSVFSSINNFFVSKFNLSIEKVFKAIIDFFIWIFEKFIYFLGWIKNKI